MVGHRGRWDIQCQWKDSIASDELLADSLDRHELVTNGSRGPDQVTAIPIFKQSNNVKSLRIVEEFTSQ